jgi:hypothetical protein
MPFGLTKFGLTSPDCIFFGLLCVDEGSEHLCKVSTTPNATPDACTQSMDTHKIEEREGQHFRDGFSLFLYASDVGCPAVPLLWSRLVVWCTRSWVVQ